MFFFGVAGDAGIHAYDFFIFIILRINFSGGGGGGGGGDLLDDFVLNRSILSEIYSDNLQKMQKVVFILFNYV